MSPIDLKLTFPVDIFDPFKQNINLSSHFTPIHNLQNPPLITKSNSQTLPTLPSSPPPAPSTPPSNEGMVRDSSGNITTPVLSEESSSSSDSSSDEGLMDITLGTKTLALETEQGRAVSEYHRGPERLVFKDQE